MRFAMAPTAPSGGQRIHLIKFCDDCAKGLAEYTIGDDIQLDGGYCDRCGVKHKGRHAVIVSVECSACGEKIEARKRDDHFIVPMRHNMPAPTSSAVCTGSHQPVKAT